MFLIQVRYLAKLFSLSKRSEDETTVDSPHVNAFYTELQSIWFSKNKKHLNCNNFSTSIEWNGIKKNASFKTFYRKQSFFAPIYPSYVCLPVTKKMFQSLRICWFIDGKCPSLEISQSCAFASTSGHVFRQREKKDFVQKYLSNLKNVFVEIGNDFVRNPLSSTTNIDFRSWTTQSPVSGSWSYF